MPQQSSPGMESRRSSPRSRAATSARRRPSQALRRSDRDRGSVASDPRAAGMNKLNRRAMALTPETLAEHASFVRTLARSLVADPHAADDLVQDAWVAALERPPRHRANLGAWLGTIVERLAWRRARSTSRRTIREEAATRPEPLAAVDEMIARGEILRRVTDAVLALEEPYQSTVLLRFYEGLEAREIAERACVPLATVRSRLQRALALLRTRLDRDHGGDRKAWCQGLVALFVAGRGAAVGTSGATGALVSGIGVGAMSTTAKTATGLAAAAILGLFVWRAMKAGDPISPVSDAGDEAPLDALLAPNAAEPSLAPESPAGTARREERTALVPADGARVAERGALEVRLTGVRDQSPVAGEELHFIAWCHASGDRAFRGFTDADGRFLLEGLLPGLVSVGTSHGAECSAEIKAGETTSVDLEIPIGFAVRGKVVDAEGLAVPGARLWLSEYFNPTEGFVIGTTRSDGAFEIDDVPDSRYLGAIADGYAPSHLHFIPDYQPADGWLDDVELTLTLNGKGGRLEVGLTRPDGRPATDALVSVNGIRPEMLRIGNQQLTSIPTFSAWSDEEGCASIDGLPPGNAEVTVYVAGMGVWRGTAMIEAGRTTSLPIVLCHEGVVTGTVRTAGGAPAEDVSVYLDDGEYDPLRPSTRSRANGRYELRGLPIGSWPLKAVSQQLGSAKSVVQIEPGVAATWDPLLSTGRVITGRAVDHEGAPLAGWDVEAQSLKSSWRGLVETDAEGTFRLVDVAEGSVFLELFRDLMSERVPTLRRNVGVHEDDLLLRVERSDLCDAALIGKIVDEQGRPIARARVALWMLGSSSAPNFETDSEGVFRAEPLRSRIYELAADFPEHPSLFLERVEIAPEEEHDLGTIVLEGPGELRITVNGRSPTESDEFSSFSFLQYSDDDHSRWAEYVERAQAGETVTLHPGRYVLQANGKPGVANERVPFELRSGEGSTLDLTPRAGRQVLAGVELREDDEFPDWVRAQVRDLEDNVLLECTMATAFDRRYTLFLPVVAGTYELEAEASDGRRARGSFEVMLDGTDTRPIEYFLPLR